VIVSGLLVGALAVAAARPATTDCTAWTLDGYRIGMGPDEIVAVRSITLHIEGQAQVVEPGTLSGVLVLEPTIGLSKWDVRYETTDGDALRAELSERFGQPTSDISGTLPGDASSSLQERRTIWWNAPCDVAIIVYENSSVGGTPVHSVHATLARASTLGRRFLESKTLLP
jgi:hypothetical protein